VLGVEFVLFSIDLFDTIKLKQFENSIIDYYQYLNSRLHITFENTTWFYTKLNSINNKFRYNEVYNYRRFILIIFQTIENWLEFDEQTMD
jgi:hypothetical protein